jgi:hypothetical protein
MIRFCSIRPESTPRISNRRVRTPSFPDFEYDGRTLCGVLSRPHRTLRHSMPERFTPVPGDGTIEYFPLTETLRVTLWTAPEPENQMTNMVRWRFRHWLHCKLRPFAHVAQSLKNLSDTLRPISRSCQHPDAAHCPLRFSGDGRYLDANGKCLGFLSCVQSPTTVTPLTELNMHVHTDASSSDWHRESRILVLICFLLSLTG